MKNPVNESLPPSPQRISVRRCLAILPTVEDIRPFTDGKRSPSRRTARRFARYGIDQELLLLAILALSLLWAVTAGAQAPAQETEFRIEPAGPIQTVERPNLANRIAWAGISILNPSSKARPVRLFGYNKSELVSKLNQSGSDDSECGLANLLSSATENDVKIAVLEVPEGDDDVDGQAISVQVADGDESSCDSVGISSELDRLFANVHADAGEYVIAFSRPVKNELVHNIVEWEFMADSDLWGPERR